MTNTRSKIAIIIGAGPAGLTAAYELLTKTKDVKPIIYEMDADVGGLAKTVNYKGNRMDIGGHRFFSKSDRVMQWWQNILPLQGVPETRGKTITLTYQNKSRSLNASYSGPDPAHTDKVMLIRHRLSRIFFLRHFFHYPITLSWETVRNLGLWRSIKIGASYLRVRCFPIRAETSLEDFFINRFGRELYVTFFKDYTEKVWGVPCTAISPEWGAQRIKGLSIAKALVHSLKQVFLRTATVTQKKIETSLIQQFLYPKFGPGQMWQEVARRVLEMGGEIHHYCSVIGLTLQRNSVASVTVKHLQSGEVTRHRGVYFFSTMPVKELIAGLEPSVPPDVRRVADGLQYRDFITVGLLLKRLRIQCERNTMSENSVSDNWIYIQEREVKLGRLQIFNNWSPYLVKDPGTVWVGLEYFCNEGDDLWNKSDAAFIEFAIRELEQIGIVDSCDILDSTLVRVPKAYPSYFGSYAQFERIRAFTDTIPNLFLIGRNGMHKYNNQDHSMLAAMAAVEHIIQGGQSKERIWKVNAERDYHE